METDNIATRLKQLINFLELSDSQFADKCGISRATLSLLLSGKNKKISDVLLSQIHEAFPQISILWLLFKEGKITNDEEVSVSSEFPEDFMGLFSDSDLLDNPNRSSLDVGSSDENSISPTSHKDNAINSNLIGLNLIEKHIQDAVSKGFERYFKNYISHNELEDLGEKAKKIRQITVYYDDSTFETFSPGK